MGGYVLAQTRRGPRTSTPVESREGLLGETDMRFEYAASDCKWYPCDTYVFFLAIDLDMR